MSQTVSPDPTSSPIDWMFRSRETGKIVIAQLPNLPLWLFIATLPFGWFTEQGSTISDAATLVGAAALLWWAVLEIVSGVNPFRRLMGLAGIGFVVARILSVF